MKELEKSKDKIQKICDMLREETLQPAQKEAGALVETAKKEAEKIVHEAHLEAKRMIDEAHAALDREKKAVHMALELAAKQSLGSLRQEIETKIFDEPLKHLVAAQSSEAKPVADLINALVKAIETDKLAANFSASVPKTCPPEKVVPLLLQEVAAKLKEGKIAVGPFDGGVQLKLEGQHMMIDISDQALKDLLSSHLRKEFRKYVFGQQA